MKKFDKYAIVYVELEEGNEPYEVFVGGDVETYFAHGKLNAFVRRGNIKKLVDKPVTSE